ncbi:MAG TPA: hypothetical protein VE733_03450 [Streptosporangiaceae bacterium]|nr:hypothetical protein [Streptosporangiaceae bacterium]
MDLVVGGHCGPVLGDRRGDPVARPTRRSPESVIITTRRSELAFVGVAFPARVEMYQLSFR